MTIGVEGREGNSVQVYDPARGELKVLDSGNAVFSALAWRKDSNDLAALRSVKNKDFEGESARRARLEGPGREEVGRSRGRQAHRRVRARPSGARTAGSSSSASPTGTRRSTPARATKSRATSRSGIPRTSTSSPSRSCAPRAIATATSSPPGTWTRTAWRCSEPTTRRPCNCRAAARARWRSTRRPTTPTAMFGRNFVDVYKVDLGDRRARQDRDQGRPAGVGQPGRQVRAQFQGRRLLALRPGIGRDRATSARRRA